MEHLLHTWLNDKKYVFFFFEMLSEVMRDILRVAECFVIYLHREIQGGSDWPCIQTNGCQRKLPYLHIFAIWQQINFTILQKEIISKLVLMMNK